ncbi:TrmH family RNA methyltransferase [Microbacterium sp. USHLN186]|uniref:TrmH family RNA methyltransferase n=1 Tax=Microbacterium sp. USHLN186 TaxID=3081286 RepID=UPI00301928E3
MPLLHIGDPADPVLDDYRSLTDTALRRVREPAGGLYIAESAKVIERALAAGHRPRSVLTQQKWTDAVIRLLEDLPGGGDVPVYVVADHVAETLTGFAVHRGVLAAMHRPTPAPVAEVLAGLPARSRVAVLEGLTDHTNVGAVFRSAAALGVDAVLVTPTCADPLYRRAVRVSMGTVFQVPWTRLPSWPDGIATLQRAGYLVAGLTLGAGAIPLDALVAEAAPRLALVFGTEGDGLRADTDERLDRRVTIPMTGEVDSLNVAAASAVAFYATR